MSTKEKENASLQQGTLSFAAGAKKNTGARGKKRTLAVTDDFQINLLSTKIPATNEVVEAMRKRILELEEQLEGQFSAKRARLSKGTEEGPQAGPSTSVNSNSGKARDAKLEAKKIDAIIKKIWSSLQKEIKTEKYKFRGGAPKTCRIEEVIEKDEFLTIFGHLGQPSADNKPTSAVIKIEYDPDDIEKLFGKHYKELKGNRYSVGGWGARFAKGEKIGLVALNILGLQVSYSNNTMKCGMKFEVEEKNPYCLGLDDEFDRPARGCAWQWVRDVDHDFLH